MGQRAHPFGIRLNAIKKKRIRNFQNVKISDTIANYLFHFSFHLKPLVGMKSSQFITAEELIHFFFLKLCFFTNKIQFCENSYSVFILVEYLALNSYSKKKILYQLSLLQKHLEVVLFNKKTTQFCVVNLSRKIKEESLSLFFKHSFGTSLLGVDFLIKAGFVANHWPSAFLFALVFSYCFTKNLKQQLMLDFVNQLFHFLFNRKESLFKSLRLEVRGRLNESDRSKVYLVSKGSLPLQSLSLFSLSYGFIKASTRYGICGIKVFFGYDNIGYET